MIKVMLILWYLLIGAIGLIVSCLVIDQAVDTESKFKEIVYKAIIIFSVIIFFLLIALLPNFIGAVIQWSISLIH